MLSRHTFQADSTSLVHSYDVYYADNVKYIHFVDKLYTWVVGKVRKIDANILENIIK